MSNTPRTNSVTAVGLAITGTVALLVATGCKSTKPEAGNHPAERPIAANSAATTTPSPPTNTYAAAAAAASMGSEGAGWNSMFDGRDLKGWRETPFAGHGEISCQSGLLVFSMGDPFTGLNWTNDFPSLNYEIALDAMRTQGSDFFCGLTVPVGTNFCSLIVGGWGGSLVGISSLDGMDASENETTKFVTFEQNRWYRIRLRITERRIEAWIDRDKLIDVVTTGRKISLRPGEIELSAPVGLAAWTTSACYRNVQYKQVDGPAGPAKKNQLGE